MRVHIEKKYKDEKERKRYEARERAKQLLKGKDKSKLTRTEKDELLLELARMHDLID